MLPSLAAVLAVVSQSPQTPPLQAVDLSSDTARQVTVDREPGQYLGHVSTVLLADGETIVGVWPRGHGKGEIVCKRSRDGGRTWSERQALPASFATSKETPTVFALRDNAGKERLVLWSGLHPARIAHSDDAGVTWSELEPAGDWGGIVVMGDIAATATAGRYLAFCHDDGRFLHKDGKAGGTFTLLQCETTDSGRTWSAPRAIWTGSEMHLCEPGAVRSDDGSELALLLRENRRRAPSQLLWSRDDGTSWSQPQPLNAALCGDRHVLRRLRDGRIAAVFRAMPLQGDAEWAAEKGDFVGWIGTYDDIRAGRAGQHRVRLLDNKDDWDCGYAGLEVLGDGTLVATTYGHWVAGEPPFIVSVRWSANELDARRNAPAPAAAAAKKPRPQGKDLATGDALLLLATLETYVPTTKAPTEAAITAAAEHLIAAMDRLAAEPEFARRCDALRAERGLALVPTEKNRIGERDPLARVLVRYDDAITMAMPMDRLRAHPAAATFPGAVPDSAPPIPCGRAIDLTVPGRHSLGIYARPGVRVTMRFGDGETPPAAKGLRVRIGAHSDDIARRPAWPRMPRVSRTFAIDRAELVVGNAYGGLVYIEVPKDCTGKLEVVIDETVPAPRFVLGETDPTTWRDMHRVLAAPWAELETDKVVLTVPSSTIRSLDDPTPLLQFWNRVLDGAADLAARDRHRERAERYVADVEISAGYMHSGYPIMTHLDAAATMTSLQHMQEGPWGLFHELGHNHQSRDWTFAGTTEVTCNIFSLYLCHVLCGKSRDEVWTGNLVRAREKLQQCLRAGKKPWGTDDGAAKPDLALRLLMYSQIEQEFGWEAFMHTFALFRDLPPDARPKTDAEKRDRWLTLLSEAIDRDMGPFFAAWGVEVGDAARKATANRQPWMPADWPL